MTSVNRNAVSVVSFGRRRRTVQLIWKGQTYHCKRLGASRTYVGGRKVGGVFSPEFSVDLA